jgi:hypothetical protein
MRARARGDCCDVADCRKQSSPDDSRSRNRGEQVTGKQSDEREMTVPFNTKEKKISKDMERSSLTWSSRFYNVGSELQSSQQATRLNMVRTIQVFLQFLLTYNITRTLQLL